MTADDLYGAVRYYTNDEVADLYRSTFALLRDLGADDQDLELTNILAQTEVDGALLLGHVEVCLTVAVASQLTQYGITLIDDDVPLQVSTTLLEGLATFEHAHIFEVTQWLLQSDEFDDVELLGEVLSLSTPLEVVDVTYYVERVSPATLRRLRSVVEETMSARLTDGSTPSQPTLDDARYRVQLLHQLDACDPPHPNQLVRQLSEAGYALGSENAMALDKAIDFLDTLDDEALIARELLGYLIYTGEDALSDIEPFVHEYASTPSQATRFLRHIDHLLQSQGYQRAET